MFIPFPFSVLHNLFHSPCFYHRPFCSILLLLICVYTGSIHETPTCFSFKLDHLQLEERNTKLLYESENITCGSMKKNKVLLASLQCTVHSQKKIKHRKTTNFKLRMLLKNCTVAISDACISIIEPDQAIKCICILFSHSGTALGLREILNEVEFGALGHFSRLQNWWKQNKCHFLTCYTLSPKHFTPFIFRPIHFNWNTIHMDLIHLCLFHQIVLQETFDVLQVFSLPQK